MNSDETNAMVSRRWVRLLGVIPALVLGACAEDPGPIPSRDIVTTTDSDGAIDSATRTQTSSATMVEETTPRQSILAGCTHIRFCNAPGPDEVVCDTDDNLAGCTRQQRLDECFDDADTVCGNWTNMRFDPPI